MQVVDLARCPVLAMRVGRGPMHKHYSPISMQSRPRTLGALTLPLLAALAGACSSAADQSGGASDGSGASGAADSGPGSGSAGATDGGETGWDSAGEDGTSGASGG